MHKRGIHRRTRKQFVTASTVFDLFYRGMVEQETSQRVQIRGAGQSDPLDHRIEIVRGHAFLSIKVARSEGESSNELGIEHEEGGRFPRRIRWDRHEVHRKQDGSFRALPRTSAGIQLYIRAELSSADNITTGPVTRLAIEAMMEHRMHASSCRDNGEGYTGQLSKSSWKRISRTWRAAQRGIMSPHSRRSLSMHPGPKKQVNTFTWKGRKERCMAARRDELSVIDGKENKSSPFLSGLLRLRNRRIQSTLKVAQTVAASRSSGSEVENSLPEFCGQQMMWWETPWFAFHRGRKCSKQRGMDFQFGRHSAHHESQDQAAKDMTQLPNDHVGCKKRNHIVNVLAPKEPSLFTVFIHAYEKDSRCPKTCFSILKQVKN
ncbi:hypothetical protein C8R47DRAFT_1066617 [Mycena vitilis]|nr:hypothetical protein C8R47DRAFT_1066617 [Mycena vitilis]